jgi:anti-sigma factor RsiW
MITCRQLVECLCDYVDGELPCDRCDEVRAHLCECPSCHAHHATYVLVIRLTQLLPAAPMPPHLSARLQAALSREQRPPGEHIV